MTTSPHDLTPGRNPGLKYSHAYDFAYDILSRTMTFVVIDYILSFPSRIHIVGVFLFGSTSVALLFHYLANHRGSIILYAIVTILTLPTSCSSLDTFQHCP